MSEKKISVDWCFNAYNDEDRTWVYGSITAAELGILLQSRMVNFDNKLWSVGILTDIAWDANGIISASIPLTPYS